MKPKHPSLIWWQSLNSERYPLMKKYEVSRASDKAIKRMYKNEVLNCGPQKQ